MSLIDTLENDKPDSAIVLKSGIADDGEDID